jgi:hypothetical protein
VAGRTFPAGERGSAAGSLLSSHCPNCTWACVLCRPSPELPFHFVWFLGWSTWHLSLDPSSVLYLQHKLCSYFDALQHLPPPQPVPRQLLPLRHIQLTLCFRVATVPSTPAIFVGAPVTARRTAPPAVARPTGVRPAAGLCRCVPPACTPRLSLFPPRQSAKRISAYQGGSAFVLSRSRLPSAAASGTFAPQLKSEIKSPDAPASQCG